MMLDVAEAGLYSNLPRFPSFFISFSLLFLYQLLFLLFFLLVIFSNTLTPRLLVMIFYLMQLKTAPCLPRNRVSPIFLFLLSALPWKNFPPMNFLISFLFHLFFYLCIQQQLFDLLVDIIFVFDVIHDCANPVGLLRALRKSIKDDGIFECLDIKCFDNVEKNDVICYGFSLMYCMTTSLQQVSNKAK